MCIYKHIHIYTSAYITLVENEAAVVYLCDVWDLLVCPLILICLLHVP